MDSLDYNYFGAAVPQSYQYTTTYGTGFGQQNGAGSIPVSIEPHTFIPGSFEYTYEAPIPRTGLTPVPQTSASPPPPQPSQLPNGSFGSVYNMDMEERSGRRSSSEEKDNLSPAQSRRKAQNRAAQRAFRERKERHVRDLEAKLDLLTTTTSSLQSDNERLKLMLRRAQTENEILRARASSSPNRREQPRLADSMLPPSPPSRNSATVQHSLMDAAGNDKNLLSAAAAWDVVQTHPRYLSGTLDIGKVCERLKEKAQCDGMGPMFSQSEVCKVIEEVCGSSGDAI